MNIRTRKPGERKPSIRLNLVVNQVTKEEFAEVEALHPAASRKSAYWRLILWHRERCPYDPDEEKAAFSDHNVNALRKAAWKNLNDAIEKVRDGLPPALRKYKYLKADPSAEELTMALQTVAAAKQLADRRGYFGRMKLLFALEKRVVERLYPQDQRKTELKRIQSEMQQVRTQLQLELQFKEYRGNDAENAHLSSKTRKLTAEWVESYLTSDLARMNIASLHPRLQQERLLMDEYCHAFAGKLEEACYAAEYVNVLHHRTGGLSPWQHAQLLGRLMHYYTELGRQERLMALLPELRDSSSAETSIVRSAQLNAGSAQLNAGHYQKYYALLVLQLFFEMGNVEHEREAEILIATKLQTLPSGPVDAAYLELLIGLATWHWRHHAIGKASALLDVLYRIKDPKPSLRYQTHYIIAHLIVLFEARDDGSLRLFARNYRRFLQQHLPLTAPALAVLVFLRRHCRVHHPKVLSAKLKPLLDVLRRYEAEKNARYAFWFVPFYQWVGT